MSDQPNDELSVLMDGELPRDSLRFLLRRADADGELTQRWSRYHIVRACLRHQIDASVGVDFSAAVMVRIEQESAVVFTGGRLRWARWVAGGAVAASVAVAALVISHPSIAPESVGNTMASTEVRITPIAQERVPSILEQKVPATAASLVDYSAPGASDSRLDSYLVRHYEATGQSMRSGLAPYVMLVVPSRATQPAPSIRIQDQPANAQ